MATGGSSVIKLSDEVYDFVCTACAGDNKTAEAVTYCVDYCGYCCKSCTDAHKKVPILKTHILQDVRKGQQASSQHSSSLEFPTERCSIHKGKLLDMYCEGHDVVGCYVCIAKYHKSCQESYIHSIPDMIDAIFKLPACKRTHSLLKEMMVSMETASQSTDTQLQTLKKAKKKALGQVSAFQKALEAILSKIAESSRKEIEVVYKQLETKILLAKQSVDNICKDLQTTDDKLNKSEGNRAQRFVCTKIAQEKIKEADGEKMKQELQHNTDVVEISFIPDQSLMEYVQALQGIGQVQKHDPYNIQALQGIGQVQKHRKQKHEVYKIRGSRDITIKLSHESYTCHSYGCCLTQDNQLLVTDWNNKKLKRFDIQKMSVVDYCTLDCIPYGVCCISKHEVAVARGKKIQFVSIHNKMTPTRQIKMSHLCYGIAFKDGQLYVTDAGGASLYVYDMTGTLLKTITRDNAWNKLFTDSRHVTFNERGDRMFVGDWNNGLVCFDGMGNYLSTITDSDLNGVDGVCVDGRGNMFVVGCTSHNVVQFSENGKKLGVVVKQGDGLQYPQSVCFHPGLNRMFVTMYDSDVVKMYELE